MGTREIIALALAFGLVTLFAIYQWLMHRVMRSKFLDARDTAASWKALYRTTQEERDLLHRRLVSGECHKVLSWQQRLEDAEEEIAQLKKLNETYKRQLESRSKKKAASGTANTESR